MAVKTETITTRTMYIVQCDCRKEEDTPFRREWLENPPREIQCPHCHAWHSPVEQSYTGKDIFNNPQTNNNGK